MMLTSSIRWRCSPMTSILLLVATLVLSATLSHGYRSSGSVGDLSPVVDMNSESAMESQLESLAEFQQTSDAAARESAAAAAAALQASSANGVADPLFASLTTACAHEAPWSTKDCLQPAWKIVGCTRRGTRYPSTEASTVLWNQMKSWADVLADMKAIAANDVQGGTNVNQCTGPREVFYYASGPNRFIWNGEDGDGYPYNTREQAQAACKSIGATLATTQQLNDAYAQGAEWCTCGALYDSDAWSFPMQHEIRGCGSKVGVIKTCSAGGATCYGVKPSAQRGVNIGIAPFAPGQWFADRWTPLVKKCSHEPPYSFTHCIRPAWKLAGCTELGQDFPREGDLLVSQWNSMSWNSVKQDMLNRARTNPASCISKFAVLDGACNHPPPYSNKRCLQPALRLAGCDENGFLWPSSKKDTASSANSWWNKQQWSVVIQDIQNWAQADLIEQRESHRGGCAGIKETFWYSGGVSPSYQFTNAKDAAEACKSIGSVLATPEQVTEAYNAGAEWCAAGFTTDGQARYPIQTPRKGCAAAAGVAVWASATKGGATCYGFKPNPKEVTGLLPFHPKIRFSQVREWKITPVTKCTKQCGGGQQERQVECINALTGKRRPEHTCRSLGPKPLTIAPCNTATCEFDWKKSPWTDCTKSCDSGTQSRTIRCLQSSTGNEFPLSKCVRAGEKQPRTDRECNTHSCISYTWKIAPWDKCSADCATGVTQRQVVCLGSDSKIHRDSRCELANGPKPITTQACNTQACPDYAWKKGPWSACSLSCNGGKTTRTVQCGGSDGSITTDESKCLNTPTGATRPRTVKACNTDACLLYSWSRGPWSNCTRTCGGGVSTRTVGCRDSLDRAAPLGACASQGPQPRTTKACNTIACRDFNWLPSAWTDCSLSCGSGSQTRDVQCVGDDGTVATDVQCSKAGPKKETKQACNTQPCVTLKWFVSTPADSTAASPSTNSLLEVTDNSTIAGEGWGACSQQCGGGVQTREFACMASDGTARPNAACSTVLNMSPVTSQACNTQPCVTYDFVPSEWSDCSLSCGGGIKTRSVPCMGSDGKRVRSSVCLAQGLTRPRKQKKCNTKQCESFTWLVGAYSACDAGCGGGLQSRSVQCQGSSGKFYDDRHCALVGDKPETIRPCNTAACVDKRWRKSKWDTCDRSCGDGTTQRDVACFGSDGLSYTDQDCLDAALARNSSIVPKKPRSTKPCKLRPCVSFYWETKEWERCSVRCGTGLATRQVVCMSTDGSEQSDSLCATLSSKPSNEQECNTEECPTYKLELSKWEDCSRSCGAGTQSRSVACVSSRGVRITNTTRMGDRCPTLPQLSRVCNTVPCGPLETGWVVNDWSNCTTECGGGGEQERLVTCNSQQDPTCQSFGPMPITQRSCNSQPCVTYEWSAGEWSDCSRSCGADGVQRRQVTCKGSDGSLRNPYSLCADAGEPPAKTKPCAQSPCISYFWKASDWSTCSQSCGAGETTRDVYCQGSDGATRPDEACLTQGPKPENTKPCNTLPCEKYQFKISEWESCTVGCGVGTQTRNVTCRSTTTQQLVNISACLSDDQPDAPVTQRECNTTPCISYYWSLGDFDECSNSCNGGYKSRTVTCMGSDGAKYKDDYCLAYSYKAPTQAICNTQPCGNFSWSPEPVWSSCSVSCDGGIQTRPYRCVGADGNNWSKSTCRNDTLALELPGPEPTQVCNTHSCTTTMWDITPWSQCTKSCGGGRQIRAVTCRKSDGTRVPSRVCRRHSPKPKSSQRCNTHVCSTYKWIAEEFGDCTVSCGGGVSTRDVRCANHLGRKVSARLCYQQGLKRPQPSQACNTDKCEKGQASWLIEPWQTCSQECGGGTRIRSVQCRVGNNDTDKYCQSILPMPVTEESCNTQTCVSFKYEPTPWSLCSKSCDDEATLNALNSTLSTAVQTRQLRCLASDGSYVSLRRCASFLDTPVTPRTERPCTTNALCPKYKWVFDSWSKCSASCGDEGTQTRRVYCTDENNVKVKKSRCVYSGPRPYSHRRCNSYPCVRDYSWQKSLWSQCSVACGLEGGVQTRTVGCVDKNGKSVVDSACLLTVGPQPRVQRTCNTIPCRTYKWSVKPFSECSTWCGGGTQTREITCSGSDGRIHKDIYCAMTNGDKADTSVPCNTQRCVYGTWKVAPEWSACTRTCGGGTRTRDVTCVSADGTVLADRSCTKDGPKPASTGECNKQPCVTTSWFIGTWSKCSAQCDGGVRTREVACIGSNGVVKADIDCAYSGDKAIQQEPCNTEACADYTRKYTPWSDCTVSCGTGTQTRSQTCFNTRTGLVPADASKCDSITIDELSRECNTDPCLTYQWNLSPWSTCSKECGGGLKSRRVTCVGSDGKQAEEKGCLLITAKPDSERACHTTPCNSPDLYGWKVNKWGECSVACGGGSKSRSIQCTRRSNGEAVADSFCDALHVRPIQTHSCNTGECTPDWKVLTDWSGCSRGCRDPSAELPVQTRQVVCVNPQGTYVDPSNCPSITQPPAQQLCNTQLCDGMTEAGKPLSAQTLAALHAAGSIESTEASPMPGIFPCLNCNRLLAEEAALAQN